MSGTTGVVVGIDFSEASRSALVHGVRLAGGGTKVTAVHVVERSVIDQLGASLEGGAERATEQVVGHTRYGIERMLGEIPGGAGVTARVVVGSADAELGKVAREVKAGMIVLGSVGQSHPGRGVGATAARCVRHAGTNVLLVRPGASGVFRRIVSCVDFSETSERALREAVSLAERDGAQLTALHVFTPPPPAYPVTDAMGMWPIPAPDYADLARVLREEAAEALRATVRSLGGVRVRIEERVVEESSYARGICEFAASTHADLVVIGTQGRSGVRYMLLGSTAERVLRDVACSVLAVSPAQVGAGA